MHATLAQSLPLLAMLQPTFSEHEAIDRGRDAHFGTCLRAWVKGMALEGSSSMVYVCQPERPVRLVQVIRLIRQHVDQRARLDTRHKGVDLLEVGVVGVWHLDGHTISLGLY